MNSHFFHRFTHILYKLKSHLSFWWLVILILYFLDILHNFFTSLNSYSHQYNQYYNWCSWSGVYKLVSSHPLLFYACFFVFFFWRWGVHVFYVAIHWHPCNTICIPEYCSLDLQGAGTNGSSSAILYYFCQSWSATESLLKIFFIKSYSSFEFVFYWKGESNHVKRNTNSFCLYLTAKNHSSKTNPGTSLLPGWWLIFGWFRWCYTAILSTW